MPDLERAVVDALEQRAREVRVERVRVRPSRPTARAVALALALTFVVGIASLTRDGLDLRVGVAAAPTTAATTAAATATPQPTVHITLQGRDLLVGSPSRPCAMAATTFVLLVSEESGRDVSRRCVVRISIDGGKSWATGPDVDASALAVSPDAKTLLIGTASGEIYRAALPYVDAWAKVYSALPGTFQPRVQAVAFSGGRVYAALRGLLASDDDGRHWRDVTAGLGGIDADAVHRDRFSVPGLAAAASGAVFVAVNGNIAEAGLWTYDGTWTRVLSGGPPTGGPPLNVVATDPLLLLTLQRSDGSNPAVPAALVSTNGGSSWKRLDIDAGSGAVITVAVASRSRFYVLTASGMLASDGGPWAAVEGVDETRVSALAADGDFLYIGAEVGIVRYRLAP